MKDIVVIKELVEWCREGMEHCDKEIRYYQGQKEGLRSVINAYTDAMEVKT